MKIAVLGAGAWGTALALSASGQAHSPLSTPSAHQVTLWARDPLQAQAMAVQRVNAKYLPGHAFPPSLSVRADPLPALRALADTQDLLIIAAPVAGLRQMLQAIQGSSTPVV